MPPADIMEIPDDNFFLQPARRRLKREHREMETDNNTSDFASHYDDFDISLSLSTSPDISPDRTLSMSPQSITDRRRGHTPALAPATRLRRREPGFDYRRPAMATPRQANGSAVQIIDLTEDTEDPIPLDEVEMQRARPSVSGHGAQRLPRYEREIIDLSDDTPQQNQTGARPPASEEDSPDVQFLSSRQLPRPVVTHPAHALAAINANTRPPSPPLSDVPEFLVIGERPRPFPLTLDRLDHHLRFHQRANPAHNRQHNYPFINANGNLANLRFDPDILAEIQPAHFDFTAVGFDLGLEREANTASPAFEAPPAAPEGFTRTPTEDEVLVCPNCDEELGVGLTEQKKQIWAVKKCGHVYCGDCTHNRALTKRKREKSTFKHPSFNKCVVQGCDKPVSGKTTMIQLYL